MMVKKADMNPPRSPCFRCREAEPNREALISYLKRQREWVTLGRRSKPAVETWLSDVCDGESFSGSVLVDANDPWIDELIELLPPGPERLLLYADMSSLVEFYASVSGEARVRVCFALGTPEKTEHILEGRNNHWMACYYAGPQSQWICHERSAQDGTGLRAKPGDLLLSQRDDVSCQSLMRANDEPAQRLVMRLMLER